MTEKMIDADELLYWLDKNFEYCNDVHNVEIKAISFKFLLKKINELATPAPEPQESIFDADGWCHNMDLAPKNGTPFFIRGGYFNSATRQIHGHENDFIQIVFYKEKTNLDVDPPYTIIGSDYININSPTSWTNIIYPKDKS